MNKAGRAWGTSIVFSSLPSSSPCSAVTRTKPLLSSDPNKLYWQQVPSPRNCPVQDVLLWPVLGCSGPHILGCVACSCFYVGKKKP